MPLLFHIGTQTDSDDKLALPVKESPVLYLEVKMAGSLSYTMEGSVQFRILVSTEESRNCDSLKVQLPHEKVKDAEGPAEVCLLLVTFAQHRLWCTYVVCILYSYG